MSTHELPHTVLVQVAEHWPPEHVCVPLHVVPQPPQLAPSVCVSTQWPLQSVGADPAQTHLPLLQDLPPVHLTPHAPQLLLSVVVSTHVP